MDPRIRRLLVPALVVVAGLVGLTGVAALGLAAGGLVALISPRLVRRRLGRPLQVVVQMRAGRVRLSGPQGGRAGWCGLEHEHGWCTLGPADENGWRTLHHLTGPAPAEGCAGLVHADLTGPDPSVLGLHWSATATTSALTPVATTSWAANGRTWLR